MKTFFSKLFLSIAIFLPSITLAFNDINSRNIAAATASTTAALAASHYAAYKYGLSANSQMEYEKGFDHGNKLTCNASYHLGYYEGEKSGKIHGNSSGFYHGNSTGYSQGYKDRTHEIDSLKKEPLTGLAKVGRAFQMLWNGE